MTTIADLIEDTSERLEAMVEMSGPALAGQTVIALGALLEIIRRQESRNQQVATALDALAASIGYPINNPREMREQVRSIAAVVRGK